MPLPDSDPDSLVSQPLAIVNQVAGEFPKDLSNEAAVVVTARFVSAARIIGQQLVEQADVLVVMNRDNLEISGARDTAIAEADQFEHERNEARDRLQKTEAELASTKAANTKIATKLEESEERAAQLQSKLITVLETPVANRELFELLDKLKDTATSLGDKLGAIPVLGTGIALPGLEDLQQLQTHVAALNELANPEVSDSEISDEVSYDQDEALAIEPDAPAEPELAAAEIETVASSEHEVGAEETTSYMPPTNDAEVQDTVISEEVTAETLELQKRDAIITNIRERQKVDPKKMRDWLIAHNEDEVTMTTEKMVAMFCGLMGYGEEINKAFISYIETGDDSLLAESVGILEEVQLVSQLLEEQLELEDKGNNSALALTKVEAEIMDSLFNPLRDGRESLTRIADRHTTELAPNPLTTIKKKTLPSLFWKLSTGLAKVLITESESRSRLKRRS